MNCAANADDQAVSPHSYYQPRIGGSLVQTEGNSPYYRAISHTFLCGLGVPGSNAQVRHVLKYIR